MIGKFIETTEGFDLWKWIDDDRREMFAHYLNVDICFIFLNLFRQLSDRSDICRENEIWSRTIHNNQRLPIEENELTYPLVSIATCI